ncbi:tripartite tricarboxylate transporter permease [Vibrio sp. SCSIO 43137]|uniref:tripartite tricarboxylate transporter permease n=1 Tax=Vibrio sp. SCSIO 43137 TaxID=3021011 RepID=UPI002307DF17|nr:tripartite tricarboxylate transporter permease [Vibrio sp. SCSIO 43137]WCE31397.1 tripartite tricarboxylate transporter permease [Vibrio sp. SCSIO 43137]
MFELSSIINGLSLILSAELFAVVIVSIFVGLIFGAMPGITTSLCLSLFFPIALSLSTASGFMLLLTLYCSTIVGAGIMAVLFNIPGNPGSIATTFDGYPMASRGKGCLALGLHISSSTAGSLISWLFLLLFFIPLGTLASNLGNIDLFLITILVIVLVGTMGDSKLIRSVISGLMGLFIAVNNHSFNQGEPVEWAGITFGDTFPLVIILVGLFAAPELYKLLRKKTDLNHQHTDENTSYHELFRSIPVLAENKLVVLRSSLIGLVIGLLPSAGAALSSMTAYFAQKRISRHKEAFGNGAVSGVIAPECANSASVGGSMLVLLLLGIPGSNSSAVIYGFLTEQGVTLGHTLYQTRPDIVYAAIFGGILSTLLLAAVAYLAAPYISRIIRVNHHVLFPFLLALVSFSAYFYRGYSGDMVILYLFGVVGLLMSHYKYPIISMVLGMFLGNQFLNGLESFNQLIEHNPFSIISRPFSLLLLLVISALLLKHVTNCLRNIRQKMV